MLLLAALAAGASFSIFGRALVGAPSSALFLDGAWAAAWQAAYEKALPFRTTAAGLWTLIRYEVFHEARPEVLIGSEGWLYAAEEFDPPDSLSVPLPRAIDLVAAARDALSAKGIDLVVALVPTKASVEERHLGRYVIPPGLASRFVETLAALRGRGITAPDLLWPLREGAGSRDMYMRTDTHWTPAGARRAAEALTPSIARLLGAHGSLRAQYASQGVGERSVSGDLLKFVPLGPWQRLGPAPDVVEEVVTAVVDADGAEPDELFSDLVIPVALVGTSYSANAVSGFEGALKDALDADVLNVAEEGKGAFAPMDAYMASPAIDDPRPDVVVWEIPERYLDPGPG